MKGWIFRLKNGYLLKSILYLLRYSSIYRFTPYILFCSLIILTFGIWVYFIQLRVEQERTRYEEYTKNIVDRLGDRMYRSKMVLVGAAAIFASTDNVTRDVWDRYNEYRETNTIYPGLSLVSYLPKVASLQLNKHIRSVRQEGFPNYSVHPEVKSDVHYPTTFLFPLNEETEFYFGFDNYSDPSMKEAIDKAQDLGHPFLSRRIVLQLKNASLHKPGFALYVPIYKKKNLMYKDESYLSTAEARREAIQGFVAGAFDIEESVKKIFQDSDLEEKVAFQIYFSKDLTEDNLMYASLNFNPDPTLYKPSLTSSRQIDMDGKEWTILFQTTPLFHSGGIDYYLWLILIGGFITSYIAFLWMKTEQEIVARAKSLSRELSKSLIENEEKYRLIVDHLPVGVSLVDRELKTVLSNQTIANWFPDSNLQERRISYGKDDQDPFEPMVECPVSLSYRDGKLHQIKRRVATTLGDRILRITSIPLVDENGNVLLVNEMIEDITDKKAAEQDRIEKALLDKSNQAKSAFIAHMSHEIRTPLNAILGFTRILLHDPLITGKQLEHVEYISSSGQHLLSLINSILDLSKIDSGLFELEKVSYSLEDLLSELDMMFCNTAKNLGLECIFEVSDDVPQFIYGDRMKLKQVLINLIGNAIKFTGKGWVALRLWVEKSNEDIPSEDTESQFLAIEVEDSGYGIPEEFLNRIFTPFEQSALGKSFGGTGLGLILSKRIVELMGGTIQVTSAEGVGTCVKILIPVTPALSSSENKIQENGIIIGVQSMEKPIKVLVADDRKDNRDLIRAILAPIGFEVVSAVDGQIACALAELYSPDIILMDLSMPVLDGFEATKRIRAMESEVRNIPIIGITAGVLEGEVADLKERGFNDFIHKPFTTEEILHRIGDLLGLEFIYHEDKPFQNFEVIESNSYTQKLLDLPTSLVEELKLAVQSGDMTEFKRLIEELKEKDLVLWEYLYGLADNYSYASLLEILVR